MPVAGHFALIALMLALGFGMAWRRTPLRFK
jgi:hypothetical protein